MKRLFASLLTLILLAVSCAPLISPSSPALTATPDPLKTAWDDRSIFRAGLVPSAQPALDQLKGASVYHLEYDIADDFIHVNGREEVRYTNNENTALDRIELRLYPNVLGGESKVSNLTVDGKSVTPDYGLQNSLLIVPINPPLAVGVSTLLAMEFNVTVPDNVDQNYGVLAYTDKVLALSYVYPMIAVYNEQGWNAEIPAQWGDITFSDMAFYIVRVRAPKDVTLIGSGREIGRAEAGQAQVVTYEAGPARDFYLAASPDYVPVSQTIGETTITFYAPSDSTSAAKAGAVFAARAVQDYSRSYAPYPYTKLDLVATPTQALGIEYPGMIAIAARILDTNDPYLEGTIAHEVGHQWFYNLVGNDQLDEPWLDESLAQFITLQYYSDEYGTQGANGFRQSLTARWDRIDERPIAIDQPVADFSALEYSGIVYGRGPLFVEALEKQMGEAAFNQFMKNYVTTYSWGIATTGNFQAAAEKACNCNLSPLFKEWVYP